MEYFRRSRHPHRGRLGRPRRAFSLEGVAVAAPEAERSVIAVASLVTGDRRRLLGVAQGRPGRHRLFELLPTMPRFTVDRVRQQLKTTFPTAGAAVRVLEDMRIVTEMTGQKMNRNTALPARSRPADG